MPRGGARKGAGRPATGPSEAAAKPVAVRLPPAMRERLRAVCEALGYTQAEVMALGIEAAEERLRRRTKG